jgi:uncharacterized protein involved in exopolysaccharide biosynthesis
MKEDKENYYSLSEITDKMAAFSRYVLRKWWVLLLFVIAGACLGAAYFYRQKPKYEAVCTFILEEKSAGGNGLAGLASQFGFNIGNMGGGSMFSGDNILTILTSKKVLENVLLSQVDIKNPQSSSLADLYLDFTGIRQGWQKRTTPVDFRFTNVKFPLEPKQDSILNDIYQAIVKKNLKAERANKQSSIIVVKTIAGDCLFARLLTERLIEEASSLYFDVKTNNAQANIDQLQRRSDSLLYLLNRKSYAAAASQPLDFNPGFRVAAVPVEIATRDKTVLATLYAEVTKTLEMSRLMLAQQTPIIQILDRPATLLSDNKKGLSFIVVVFSFIAGIFCIVGLTAWYFLRNMSKS